MSQILGTTSWVIPGTYYENVEYITRKFRNFEFIELLVYTWDDDTYRLFEQEKEHLRKIALERQIKYTVHLPTDNIKNVLNAFKYLEMNLDIANYVLHPFEDCTQKDKELFHALLAHPKISIENLKERVFNHLRTVFDVGHHILGAKVENSFIDNIVEIHMMGVTEGKDHQNLDLETLEKVYQILSGRLFTVEYLCFEIFNEDELEQSLELWEEFKNKIYNTGSIE